MKLRIVILVAGILLAIDDSELSAQGFGALVPSDSALEANSSTLQPFSIPFSRFQQVYLAGNLIDFDPNAVTRLSSLYFRLDSITGTTIGGQPATLEIRMSTTSRTVDGLSPVFGDNIGADETTVFAGTIQWSAFHHPGATVEPFDLRIALQQPFFYRPSMGNLLVDFTVSSSAIQSELDAWSRSGDPVSSVFGSSTAPSGTASSLGLVTYFVGNIVPEPSSFAIALIGIAVFAFMRRRRKQTKA